jgi:hypothetical protein
MSKIFNYNLTHQIYNSDNTFAKIAKYSLIGITLVASVETIKNIVLTPFILTADFCISKDENKKDFYKNQFSLINEYSESQNNQQKTNLKKIAIGISLVILGIITIAAYTNPDTPKINTAKDATQIACEKIFADNFNGTICSIKQKICNEIVISGMDPAKYFLHKKNSYHLVTHNQTFSICTATLHEAGRKLISTNFYDPWKIYLKKDNFSSFISSTIWWDSTSDAWKSLFGTKN